MSSRTEQKEAARRAREAQQRAQVAADHRRRRLLWLGVAAGAAAVVLIIGIVISQSGSDDAEITGEDTAMVREEFAGLPQQGNVLGPPGAAAKLVEYGDLQCPACATYSSEALPQVLGRFVRPGRLKLELRLIPIIGPESELATEAAAAASFQDRMWQFSDVFFRNQGTENSGYVTTDFLTGVAEATPGLDAARAIADSSTPRARALAARWAGQAERAAVSSTPSFFLEREGEAPRPVLFTADFITELEGLLAR